MKGFNLSRWALEHIPLTRYLMAALLIGGLVSSTLLTLVLVPVLYSLVEGFKQRVKRRRGGGSAKHAAPRHEQRAEEPTTGLGEELAEALR